MSARGDLGEQVSELKGSRARLDEEQRLLDSHEKSVQQYQDLVEQQLAVYEGMDGPDGTPGRPGRPRGPRRARLDSGGSGEGPGRRAAHRAVPPQPAAPGGGRHARSRRVPSEASESP